MNKDICDIIYKYFHYFQFKEVLEEYESKVYHNECIVIYNIKNRPIFLVSLQSNMDWSIGLAPDDNPYQYEPGLLECHGY